MAIVGQFRDLDDQDRFVWIRGFGSMPARARALAAFYGGPVWKANSAAANATMIDSDNVLLLRPVTARSGFPAPQAARLPAGRAVAGTARILVTIYYRDQPFDQAFADFFDRQARPVLIETGATPVVCFQTEHAENTFPALPVRTGENVFMWLARFPSSTHLRGHLHQIDRSGNIVVEALSYIRGRSIANQFMIIDEAQNLTPLETKTIITRVGNGTKIVFTGDPYQIDNPYVDSSSNGFNYVVSRFRAEPIAAHIELQKGERSELAELAANIL